MSSFCLKRSGVQVSFGVIDAREVLGDWLIANKPRKRLKTLALWTIRAVVRVNKHLFAFAFALYLNDFFANNKTIPGRKTALFFAFAFAICINGPLPFPIKVVIWIQCVSRCDYKSWTPQSTYQYIAMKRTCVNR